MIILWFMLVVALAVNYVTFWVVREPSFAVLIANGGSMGVALFCAWKMGTLMVLQG